MVAQKDMSPETNEETYSAKEITMHTIKITETQLQTLWV
jgi:hypothetical protein